MKTPIQIFILICMHLILILLDTVFRLKELVEEQAPEFKSRDTWGYKNGFEI